MPEKFSPSLSLRIRILLTTVLVFGIITALIGLLLAAAGITGSGSLIVWLMISLFMLALQWYFGPTIIKIATGAKELKYEDAPEIFQMVERLCRKAELPIPKIYLVDDPTPNAFAFGRTQKDSGVAIHRGLLSVLDKEEIEGVIAHELGHINNRDVAVMTVASVLPVALYYGVLIFGSDREGRNSVLTIIGAFVAQFLGQLMVMWLSRQREYFADEFSARLTGNPAMLMRALAKISYGVKPHAESSSMVRALYFAESQQTDMQLSKVLSLIDSGNRQALLEAIEKEKKSGFFEIFMTHPLTAKRLEHLSKLAM
ncbi:MAG: zinc metalloprotease HtpX [Candidatus Micrarchaeota archaeon]|nr:zinc metalloprotease HtpX [Candidatus Micrarchaeota archaeon]